MFRLGGVHPGEHFFKMENYLYIQTGAHVHFLLFRFKVIWSGVRAHVSIVLSKFPLEKLLFIQAEL